MRKSGTIELHEALGLDVQQSDVWKHMEIAANTFRVNVHLFDTSNITPGFSYHYPPQESSLRSEKNQYFLQDGDHFHYITNVNTIIRDFKHNEHYEFCETCFKIYDRRFVDREAGHICSFLCLSDKGLTHKCVCIYYNIRDIYIT